jgi:hypothetical protein
MQVYSVSMWLTCKSNDSDILKAFDARWTASLQRSWDTLVINASNSSDLAVTLNAQIYKDCKAQISNDINVASPSGFDGIDSVAPGSWTSNGNGSHKFGPDTVVATHAGIAVAPWTFPADNGKTGTMYVEGTWKLVTVINVPTP